MTSENTITFPIADRWSYLWLLLAALLGLFSLGQWAIPLGAFRSAGIKQRVDSWR